MNAANWRRNKNENDLQLELRVGILIANDLQLHKTRGNT